MSHGTDLHQSGAGYLTACFSSNEKVDCAAANSSDERGLAVVRFGETRTVLL